MFGPVLALVSTFVLAYAAWRASSVPWLGGRMGRRPFWSAVAAFWIVMVSGRLLGHDASFPGASLLEFAGMTLLGVLFLCFLPLLATDLATGFGAWGRGWLPRLRGGSLLAGLALAAFASIQAFREPEIVDYEVVLPGLPPARDGLVIVALSDLHLGALAGPGWLEARMDQVRSLRPDLVLFLGDLFEGRDHPDARSVRTLRSLRAPLGVWGVEGNHEHYGLAGSPMDGTGIHVLRNGMSVPVPGLVLAGRAESGRRITGDAGKAWNPPRDRPPGALILLSHVPGQAREAARAGAALMLSGHTHGGQIWPFGCLVARAYPVLDGETRIGAMTLIVNRGAGTWGPRMRLWRRGEISRIRLRSAG